MSKIIATAKFIFLEAFASGLAGSCFDEAWPESKARTRLMQPAADDGAARDRRDRVLYFFEEGLRAGHYGGSADAAWVHSYSLVIARDLAERAELRKAA